MLTPPQPQEKHRDVNQFQRFEKRPAPVHKLGHFGMCVTDFAKAYDFYSTHFNFYPSEVRPQDTTPPFPQEAALTHAYSSSTTTRK